MPTSPTATRLAEVLEVASAAIIERDRLKAINAELLAALEALCDLMPQTRPGNMQSDEYHIWLQADKARTAIAKAQPSSK